MPNAAATSATDLSIIVPVYNEAENFAGFHRSLKTHVRTPYTLVVVYDFEEDTTLPVVRGLQETDPSIVLLKNPQRGVLGALKTGLRYPKQGAVMVTMADGSDDHSIVDQMYRLYRQGNHVVSASRYARGGGQRGGPLLKKTLSRAAGMSLRLFTGLPTWDATNNFKLYSRELLERVEIESVGGFEVALELTVKAHGLGLAIAEIPTVWTDRTAGESHFQLKKWLPKYMRWYFEALSHGVRSRLKRN